MEFQSDRRSQSTVIGVVVLFGFFILALSLYQAQVVPQQNAETEFDHFQEAKNEFTVLRTAISRAGQTDVAQYENFKLGTNYRQRLFTLNPPAPAGQLQTTQPYNLTIDGRVIQTRFLEYEDGYHELRVGSIWYDNSVVYLEGRTDAERVIIEDQNLVTDDGQLRVTALQNSIETSGVRRVPVEFYPVENPTLTDSDFTGELSVRIPTRLNGSYWDDEIPSTLWTSTSSAVDVSAYPDDDDVYALALTVNSADLKFNTVGINSGPEDVGESLKQNVGAAPENSGGNGGSGGGRNNGGGSNTGDQLQGTEVAFNDANNNGVYDAGEEEAYSTNDLKGFDNDSADLIIEKNVSSNGAFSIIANTVTVRSGTVVESQNNKLSIGASGGGLDAAGATLRSGNRKELILTASGAFDGTGATIDSSGKLEITPNSGNLDIGEATVQSGDGKELILTASGTGAINASSATIESAGKLEIEASNGLLNMFEATVRSGDQKELIITATQKIVIASGTVDSAGKLEIETSSGPIDMFNATVRAGDGKELLLIAAGDIDAGSATIQSDGSMKATPGSQDQLFVDNARIIDSAENGAELALQQGSSTGTPAKGEVT
jgi:hypothetical protein